ncbi:MAG: TfoX/Sxy family protein, partial [Pseudomonadota bacterium]
MAAFFAPFRPLRVRRMFGGFGVYADGTMFGLAAGGEVHLKADTAFAETLAD